MSDDRSMQGSSVLIAGASGGLGSAIARDLAARGATLTLAARSSERLAAVDAPGHRVAVDLRSPEACEAAVRAAVEHAGGLDVVVNAVGVVAFGPVADLSIDAMEELFLTNTFVPIMLARAALPVIREGGAIVNISGVIAEQNLPGMAAYGASKAAVRSFDEAFGREARRRKIRVIDARPPHTETGLATRPIEGDAPKMPTGLSPDSVATTICEAIAGTATDLPSGAFG
ncbi:MAG: SDR family oxidoreductase [Ilumatobacter sp.]|uniref:SDR family NAD(P)-dependent oxidoreductase n=1 Tax=Ilumatobacter sp. TaxID=1967498 RepID=UPI00261B175B|nr:SDR family oxidoreductase [Ilumatobacter sp.]MDJ0768904.1 SDR family oxidoreductase [Ilumatobacter sp.]